jgi:hypothetical protein
MIDIKFLEQRLNARFYPHKISVIFSRSFSRDAEILCKEHGLHRSYGGYLLWYRDINNKNYNGVVKDVSEIIDGFDEVTL